MKAPAIIIWRDLPSGPQDLGRSSSAAQRTLHRGGGRGPPCTKTWILMARRITREKVDAGGGGQTCRGICTRRVWRTKLLQRRLCLPLVRHEFPHTPVLPCPSAPSTERLPTGTLSVVVGGGSGDNDQRRGAPLIAPLLHTLSRKIPQPMDAQGRSC